MMKKYLKIFYFVLIFLTSFYFNTMAGPTFVRSASVENVNNNYIVKALNFNNDGSKMYTSAYSFGNNQRSDRIYEYTLTIPYNISTATLRTNMQAGQFSIALGNTSSAGGSNSKHHGPTQVVFNNDGTKMFVTDFLERVFEYALSTPFDIDTATTDMVINSFDLNASGNAGDPEFTAATRLNSLAFNNDGTKLFVTDIGSDNGNRAKIHEFDLSSPFNFGTVSSAVSPNITAMRVGSQISEFSTTTMIEGIVFNYNGTKMFISNSKSGDSELIQYKLTTAYNTSTRVHEGTLDMTTLGVAEIAQQVFSSDGSKLFVLDNATDKVFEFDLTCDWSIIDGACDDPVNTSDKGKDVLSSIESQTATAKKIAIQASTPVLNRMYWLRRHRTNDKLSNQNIKFNFSNSMMDSLSKAFPVSKKTNEVLDKLSDSWSFWSEGSISVGRTGDTSTSSSKEIDSRGITFGMDKKISENRLYGYAIRFGNDQVDVGSSGTFLDTNSLSVSLYGTFPQNDKRFIESILGIGKLETDHVRKSSINTNTGERDGSQIFGSINYVTTYEKEEFSFAPNLRIDLSYTELSKYRETGTAALVYKAQKIKTGMISTGFTVSDIIDYNFFTFKPNTGLEAGIDFSPSSDATYRYLSETTEYTKSIDQDSKNIRANIGFDLVTDNGFSLMTIYERNQSDNSHSDTIYLGFGYIPTDDIEYAMNLENDEVFLNYEKNLNGFDIRINSNYNLISSTPDYGTAIEFVSTF